MSYTHLTEDERYTIYEMRKEGHRQEEIARHLKRSPASISRELQRNSGERGYRPRQAQHKAQDRARGCANGRRVSEAAWTQAQEQLREEWSPEQMAGRLKRTGTERMSHETIYRRVYADKAAGGDLWRNLRCQKLRRKRYGSGQGRRGQIPNRVSIDERPPVVAAKTRVGDWEGDTVIGAGQRQALVSLVERKTQFTVLAKVPRKTAQQVTDAAIAGLRPLKAWVHTVTFDNGTEFSWHEQIASALDTAIYFAHPYASWERGLNEQVNGLIRQYFPKKCRFETITDTDVKHVMDKLNNRPRKSLAFKTPREMLLAEAKRKGVALRI